MAAKGSERGITVNLLAFGAFTALSGSMEDEEGRKRQGERIGAELVSPAVLWLSHKDNQ